MDTPTSSSPSNLQALGQFLYGITFTGLCIAGGIGLVLLLTQWLPAIWRRAGLSQYALLPQSSSSKGGEDEAFSPLVTAVVLVGLAGMLALGVVLVFKGASAGTDGKVGAEQLGVRRDDKAGAA